MYWGRSFKSIYQGIISMLNKVGWWLLIIGGLNWGVFGLLGTDLVGYLAGGDMTAMLPRIVYILVGLAALWALFAGGAMKR